MRAGAIPLPLNIRLAAATLTDIIGDAACVLALVDPTAHRDALSIARSLPLRQRLLLDDTSEGFLPFETELAQPAPAIEPPVIEDNTQAFQPYTSGSTGRPKGAIMTHRGMLWYVAYNQRYWPSAESDRGLIALPLFHKNALRGTVKPCFMPAAPSCSCRDTSRAPISKGSPNTSAPIPAASRLCSPCFFSIATISSRWI
jgi:long-chain acyl-CoA synthetase